MADETTRGKTALVTGITGQDGAYLTRLLLDKQYTVYGLKRRSSVYTNDRIDSLFAHSDTVGSRLILHNGDLTDSTSIIRLVDQAKPDEIYNLAAQSHVATSFDTPEFTANVDAIGVLRILEAIRICGLADRTRFCQASTSEMFGRVAETPQTERTPFYPRSPYAVAKAYAYWITVNYREAYGLFASNAISFNHESPIRGETFVTRKITRGLARIKLGLEDCLYLGNLDADRDWGHARDYVRAYWLMCQHSSPDDYVVATGKRYSVRSFVEHAADVLDIKLLWIGSGLGETAIDEASGKTIIRISESFFRPTEVDTLMGDATKARQELGWRPEVSFVDLVREMVEFDLHLTRFDVLAREQGFAVDRQYE